MKAGTAYARGWLPFIGARRTNKGVFPRGEVAKFASITPVRTVPPHCLVFFLFSALYFIPLLLVSLSGYGEGLVSQTGADAGSLMQQITVVYLLGMASFFLGSWAAAKLTWLLGETRRSPLNIAFIRTYPENNVFILVLVVAFVVSKLLLIPAGVYSNYAFDSAKMDSPIWTASMFFSEILAFVSLIALFSRQRRNLRTFVILTLINGVNLLHGTRNFFLGAMTAVMVYMYTRTRTSLTKMLFLGGGVFLVAVLLAYVVYLHRAHAPFTDFSSLSILSPITYESLFSQISLINVLQHPQMYSNFGHVHRFVQDVVTFSSPRFLVGDKEALLWARRFAELSPLGGFNGFALGMLYFGYLFPIAYFLLGLFGGLLHRMARTQAGAALYVYFCCDFIYRLQRDGYLIPAKMMINNAQVLLLLGLVHWWRHSNVGHSSHPEEYTDVLSNGATPT